MVPVRKILLICLLCWMLPVSADAARDFSFARDAYVARDAQKLRTYANSLQQSGYLLAPYVEFWQMLLNLEQYDDDSINALLMRHDDFYVSQDLRSAWLKSLANRGKWERFFTVLPDLSTRDEAINCLEITGRFVQGKEEVLVDGKRLWIKNTTLLAECSTLFDNMQTHQVLDSQLIWEKVYDALSSDQVSLAHAALLRIPNAQKSYLDKFQRVSRDPVKVLKQRSFAMNSRIGRTLNLYGFMLLSRKQSELALRLWEGYQADFNERERGAFWAAMARNAVARQESISLKWYARTRDDWLSLDQLAWKARAALRWQHWDVLVDTIDHMPKELQEEQEWVYWKAIAYKQKGDMARAQSLLATLVRYKSFYGILAEEQLGPSMGETKSVYKANPEELRAMGNAPFVQRAWELFRISQDAMARKEWSYSITRLDDRQLLAAASIAEKNGYYDLAINTADKTRTEHDFSLRYPLLYRDILREHVRLHQLDEAWVYGLIRQESRFASRARSYVGASGLMQVMPKTGAWLARKLGLLGFTPNALGEVQSNVQLGTYYLRYLMDSLGGNQILSTAAYNAGPGRARAWQGSDRLDGVAYIETIPFQETRGYVKKVLSNMYYYTTELGISNRMLNTQLGYVPGRGSTDSELADDQGKPD